MYTDILYNTLFVFSRGYNMFDEFFSYKKKVIGERDAIVVTTKGAYSLFDTLECGQCFRYEKICDTDAYKEYVIPTGSHLIGVAQKERGELIFYGISEDDFLNVAVPFFSLDTDYTKIRDDIISRTDSEWLKCAATYADGIAILRQDAWEALFSFIISQNNNIPRIKKIIRELSCAYGVNLTLQNGGTKCPCNKTDATPCDEICSSCGVCYTFPKAEDVAECPDKMLPSHPGFRYKYLLDAAEKVAGGSISLDEIKAANSYEFTVAKLKEIKGVGDKVAACCALFGFGNLEAFPIDVWMKRAIDTYFNGKLDPATLGPYAGIAQQYIFHYIRNIEGK